MNPPQMDKETHTAVYNAAEAKVKKMRALAESRERRGFWGEAAAIWRMLGDGQRELKARKIYQGIMREPRGDEE